MHEHDTFREATQLVDVEFDFSFALFEFYAFVLLPDAVVSWNQAPYSPATIECTYSSTIDDSVSHR